MPIRVQCGACSINYNVPDTLAGKRLKCKKCEAPIQVPAAHEPPIGDSPVATPVKVVAKAKPVVRPVVRKEEDISDAAPVEKENEVTVAEAKVAKKKAKREAKAKQSRKAVKGCLLIALGLLLVGAGVAAYFFYYPLIDRKVHAANLFRQYKSVEKSLEKCTNEKAKMDLKLKKLAIFMTFESNQFTEEQKAKLREHFLDDWPKYGTAIDEIWDRQVKYKIDQDKKSNPAKYTPIVAWEAKPDPGAELPIPENPTASLPLPQNPDVVSPRTPSPFVILTQSDAKTRKRVLRVFDLGTLLPKGEPIEAGNHTPAHLSPDGNMMAYQRPDGTVRKVIVSTLTGESIAEVGPINIGQGFRFAEFLPGGEFLSVDQTYSDEDDCTFNILDLKTKLVRKFKTPSIHGWALSPNGRYLACTRHNMGRIALVDLKAEKICAEVQYVEPKDRNSEPINTIAFSPNGEFMVAAYGGNYKKQVLLWKVGNGELSAKFELPAPVAGKPWPSTSQRITLQWLPDGSGWLVGEERIFDIKGQLVSTLPELPKDRSVPRRVLGGGYYTDDRVGALNKPGKLTFEKLPTK